MSYKVLKMVFTALLLLCTVGAANAATLLEAKVVKLVTYKNYRTVVQVDKAIADTDGCTHGSRTTFFALNIHSEKPSTTCTTTGSATTVCTTNQNAIEEVYASLLAAKMSDSEVNIQTAGCTPYGNDTIPTIIRVDLM